MASLFGIYTVVVKLLNFLDLLEMSYTDKLKLECIARAGKAGSD